MHQQIGWYSEIHISFDSFRIRVNLICDWVFGGLPLCCHKSFKCLLIFNFRFVRFDWLFLLLFFWFSFYKTQQNSFRLRSDENQNSMLWWWYFDMAKKKRKHREKIMANVQTVQTSISKYNLYISKRTVWFEFAVEAWKLLTRFAIYWKKRIIFIRRKTFTAIQQ